MLHCRCTLAFKKNTFSYSFEKKIVRLEQKGNHAFGFAVRGGKYELQKQNIDDTVSI